VAHINKLGALSRITALSNPPWGKGELSYYSPLNVLLKVLNRLLFRESPKCSLLGPLGPSPCLHGPPYHPPLIRKGGDIKGPMPIGQGPTQP